jgi:hypothetical protein
MTCGGDSYLEAHRDGRGRSVAADDDLNAVADPEFGEYCGDVGLDAPGSSVIRG